MADTKYPHGRHPNSLRNLKPQKTGERSHNPEGKPKKEQSITACLRRLLETPGAEGKNKAQLLAEVWYNKALTEARYFEMLLDRMEGKVTQPIGGEGGKPIEVSIDYRSKIISAISRHASASGAGKDDSKPQ